MLQRLDPGEVDAVQHELRRMQATEPFAHALVDDAVVRQRRFPAHAAEQAQRTHGLLLLRDVEVRDGAVEDFRRHAHRLAERGMRMDGVADVGDLAAHLDRQRGLGDQVARVHADDAGADDAMTGFVEDQLGEAFGTAEADRAARRGPRELADADLQALGLRLGLGDADPRDCLLYPSSCV